MFLLIVACTGSSPDTAPTDSAASTTDTVDTANPIDTAPPTDTATDTCLPTDTASPDTAEIEGWTLVWRDEFDGDTIDLTRWGHEVNADGGGNNELQYYTDRPTNSRVEDGTLILEAHQETYTADGATRFYTSARLRTLGLGDWTYGRFEARLKTPVGQGLWPAFWMLPTDWAYGGWAASGEIDVMELLGHQPETVHGSLHYGGPWPDNTYASDHWTLAESFAEDFHTFAVEWEPGEIRWYVDGTHTQTRTSWYSTAGAYPAPFDQRFHILLNVAVGGDWPGSPDETTVFPQQMVVDYVRVYDKTGGYDPVEALTLTVDTRCTADVSLPPTAVSLTGPWAGDWDPGQAWPATDNGDGTWSVPMAHPTSTIEYLWIVDGVYENLIDDMQAGHSCAPVTDYWSYANRVWSPGDADPTVAYGSCEECR